MRNLEGHGAAPARRGHDSRVTASPAAGLPSSVLLARHLGHIVQGSGAFGQNLSRNDMVAPPNCTCLSASGKFVAAPCSRAKSGRNSVTRQAIRAGRGQADAARTMAIWGVHRRRPWLSPRSRWCLNLDLVVSRQFALGRATSPGLHSNLALSHAHHVQGNLSFCAVPLRQPVWRWRASFAAPRPCACARGSGFFWSCASSVGPGLVVNVLLEGPTGPRTPCADRRIRRESKRCLALHRSAPDRSAKTAIARFSERRKGGQHVCTAFCYSVALIAPQWSRAYHDRRHGGRSRRGVSHSRVARGTFPERRGVCRRANRAGLGAGLHRLIFGPQLAAGGLDLLLSAHPSRGS